jgi:fermentation-respiration switch protein FrsA (DUF1100 family)
MYHRRLFHPTKGVDNNYNPPDIEGTVRLDVAFPSADGRLLHGWFFDKPGAKKVVLYCHGNAGNIVRRYPSVRSILQSNVSLLIFDYRGFGRSHGTPSVKAVCQDGVAAYDFLVKESPYRAKEVVVYGESLGAAIACHVAANRPCGGIILQSGFYSLLKIGRERLTILRAYPEILGSTPRMNNASLMRSPHPPLLILHGEKDSTIPIAHSEKLFAEAAEPKRFVRMPDATHTDLGADAALYVSTIDQFINSLS